MARHTVEGTNAVQESLLSATRSDGGEHIRLLLELLQPGSGDLSWRPKAGWDWRAFAKICDAHHVGPFVYRRVQSTARPVFPAALVDHMKTQYRRVTAKNYLLAMRLVDLTSRLQNEGIPALAFKGPAVAMLAYGDLAVRPFSDLDLIVRKEHIFKAVAVLTRWGFQMAPMIFFGQLVPSFFDLNNPRHIVRYHEVSLWAPDGSYFVDLHWQLGDDHWRAFSPNPEKLWERAQEVELPQGNISTLCPEDLFLALCYHGTKHRWLALKWLLDVAELLRKSDTLNWPRIEDITRFRPRARVPASLAVLLARQLLNAPLPPEAERILPVTERIQTTATAIGREILLRGHASENNATLLELEASPIARMKYRATRMVRYPGWLIHATIVRVDPKDLAWISLPHRLHFLYHAVRPMRLLVKYGARVATCILSLVPKQST